MASKSRRLYTVFEQLTEMDPKSDVLDWADSDLPELAMTVSELFDTCDIILCPQCRAEVLPDDFSRATHLDCSVCGYSGPVETFNLS